MIENVDLISIIVPIYKVENYIRQCIESILNQTYTNLEIILVDDGSPDDCGKICDYYAKKDKRIKVIHKNNGGLSDARNRGIKIVKGKYIGFVDSDDYIAIDMYEYLYNLLIKDQADISVCNFFYENENNKIIKNKNSVKRENSFNNMDSIKELLKDNCVQNYAWNKLYKKDLFVDIKYPEGKKMEDLGTTYKLFYKSNKVVVGEKSKYYYRQRKDSITGSKQVSVTKDMLELSIERYNFLKDIMPNTFENDLALIEVILHAYRFNDKELNNYIINNKINDIFKELIRKNFFSFLIKAKFKTKIKFLLYSLNKRIYQEIHI